MTLNNPLDYPFDTSYILKKRRSIKKYYLSLNLPLLEKKIAILGGSTTHDIKEILELFLLQYGIKPIFYESEYAKYWEDALFPSDELKSFNPDFIFIHTSNRNILEYPTVKKSADEIDQLLQTQFQTYVKMWESLTEKYGCPIIQNNFEMPQYRLLGNSDVSNIHGRTNYLTRLNMLFYEYAQTHPNFFINDINYLSANYGLEKWSDTFYWHMYKYALSIPAIPYLAFSVANIIKSILGKNKKGLVIDLDNTLWGGVVGDDGVDGLEIGHETSMGQVYTEFQEYIKSQKDIGVILNVNSKNEYENAIAGLNHPEGTLHPDDFIVIKANWENKDKNFMAISNELNLLPESLVFVDDNPVERGIITEHIPGVVAPSLDKPENYINILDKSGFFEVTSISDDDIKRNEMYKENIERTKLEKSFDNYEDYLKSLEMSALIKDFDDLYIQRITQLTNKSNQFNLTTKRYTQTEMEEVAASPDYIRLYGKLTDKYGDNGVITVVIGKIENNTLHMVLWLMSCRVLKRNMELAILDELVSEAKKRGVEKIMGYYYKTQKNSMVKEHYGNIGFTLVKSDDDSSVWELDVNSYRKQNNVINVN